jgi:hypothetical protein
MARRKITVEDALRVLEEAGIPLQAKVIEVQPPPVAPVSKISQPARATQVLDKLVKITLYAKHSVGSGGRQVIVDGEKQVENAGVQTYGPGICTVPSALANHLLSADQTARAADARMLEREQRSYIVAQRRNPDGYVTNVALQIPTEVFEGGLDTLPADFTFVVR